MEQSPNPLNSAWLRMQGAAVVFYIYFNTSTWVESTWGGSQDRGGAMCTICALLCKHVEVHFLASVFFNCCSFSVCTFWLWECNDICVSVCAYVLHSAVIYLDKPLTLKMSNSASPHQSSKVCFFALFSNAQYFFHSLCTFSQFLCIFK